MKNITMSKGPNSCFANPKVTVEVNDGLKFYCTMQVMVATDKNDNWVYDDIEVVDIDEIEYMGLTIKGYNDIKKFNEHHKSLGINIWEIVNDAGMSIVKSYSPNDFVSKFTDFNYK